MINKLSRMNTHHNQIAKKEKKRSDKEKTLKAAREKKTCYIWEQG